MIREKVKKFEYTTLTIAILIISFGLLVLYSASYNYAKNTYGNEYYLIIRQSLYCIIGMILIYAMSIIDRDLIYKCSKTIFYISIMLVIIVTISGKINRGASRWLNIYGVSFQPSEFLKIALILYLARIVVEYKEKIDIKENFYKVLLISYIPTFIVAINNLSTSIILFTIATLMIFLASKKKLIFIIIFLSIIIFYIFAKPMTTILYNIGILKNYQINRLFAWTNPFEYKDIAYQTIESINAIGSGRIYGRGFLNSIQKNVIPEVHNDMIFSILCEEFGIIGAYALIILYSIMIFRILYLSYRHSDMYSRFVLFGIAIHISMQVICNIAVATNMIPNTGVTLPFISYGGSSIIVLSLEIGIVMSFVKNR